MARFTDQDYELLSAYLDGALTTAERSALDARLQAEPELHRELDSLRQTVNLIRALPLVKAPRDYTLDARYTRPARLWIFPASSAFSAISAAAAMLLVVLGVVTLLSSGTSQTAPSAGAPLVALQATVQLSDTLDEAENAVPLPLDPITAEGFTADDAQLKMEATLTIMSEAQEENSAAMQRQTVPGAQAVPAMPQPQDSPPPSSLMGSAARPTGTADLFFGAEEAPDMTGAAAADSSAMEAAQPTMTVTLSPTNTATPSVTPSYTPTHTPQPTTTLTPTPVRGTSAPVGTSTVGAVMVLGGVALLALAIATSLVRKRIRP